MAGQQKALLLPVQFGEFTLGTTRVYKPGPGELLVKNKAASLNPVDWKLQKYEAFIKEYPAILGTDVAGDVDDIGEGVVGFSKGDRMCCGSIRLYFIHLIFSPVSHRANSNPNGVAFSSMSRPAPSLLQR